MERLRLAPSLGGAVSLALLAASAPSSPQERRAAKALRIDPAQVPRVDGVLDDAVWARASEIGPLVQVEPVEGAEPSERTAIRIAYDPKTLYLAVAAYDSDPAGIVGRQARRDARLDSDDRVEFVLDTFHDRRNAYFFQVSPGGSLGDALVTGNGGDFNKDWDGIWEGAVRTTEDGWFAELAIPLRTLAFDAKKSTWGLNVERAIQRRNERARWSAHLQRLSLFRISEAGDLEGIEELERGLGLDLVPYGLASFDRAHEPRDADFLATAGGDAFYRITSGITGAVTLNTDFAETEVDERRVNLTRFPLFFPEKRDFFLEDAGIFAFEVGGPRGPGSFREGRDLVPFFSRRIGLDEEGREVPILGGLKVSGREGPWSLGLLDVGTDARGEIDAQNLLVGRVQRNFAEQSTVGAIFTHGDPLDEGDNALAGMDLRYRTTSFAGDKNLDLLAFGLHSWSEGEDEHAAAYGAEVSFPQDTVRARLGVRAIQEDFRPALGFVRRTGIRQYQGEFFWRPRPGGEIRQLSFGITPDVITDTHGRTETVSVRVTPLRVEFESGDEVGLSITPNYDRLEEPFEIVPGIEIPEGEYDFLRAGASFETASKRELAGGIFFETGEFYDGHRTDLTVGTDWRPGGLFQGSLDVIHNFLRLPEGRETVRTVRLRAEVNFDPRLSWMNLVQFVDGAPDGLGVNSRLRWIVRPGHEVFLVFNQGWEENARDALVPTATTLTAKVVYAVRF